MRIKLLKMIALTKEIKVFTREVNRIDKNILKVDCSLVKR